MARIGFDIGSRNLSWCVRWPKSDAVTEWCLCDLVAGTYVTLHQTAEAFQAAGKKPTIQTLCASIVVHLNLCFPNTSLVEGVVIEAQLGRVNTTAKVLSHAVQTYFLTRGVAHDKITFRRPFSATLDKKMAYKKRKQAAIEQTKQSAIGDEAAKWWLQQKKLDDLADSYLLLRDP